MDVGSHLVGLIELLGLFPQLGSGLVGAGGGGGQETGGGGGPGCTGQFLCEL